MKSLARDVRRAVVRGIVIGAKVWRRLFPPAPPPAPARAADAAAGELPGRVVVITGSSRGLGLALARAFLEAGARVVINGRDERALAAAHRELRARHQMVRAVRADVATEEGAAALLDEAERAFGPVDVLINNAGVAGPQGARLWELPLADWRETLDANVTGPFLCAARAARRAHENGHRLRIVNVSSGIVGLGAAGLSAYGVSKSALEGLTVAVAADAGDDDLVSAVSIRPRSVRTRLTRSYYSSTEYGLLDEPEAAVSAFLYAAVAPAGEVAGRAFFEPELAADPRAATGVVESAPSSAIRIRPDTFVDDARGRRVELPGAYMHLLENPLGHYASVAHAVAANADSRALYAYPDPAYPALRAAIAAEVGIEPDGISVGPGSTEIIDRALRLFCAPGDTLVVTKPTWSFFWSIFARYRLVPKEVPHLGSLAGADIRHDLDGLLRAVTPRTRFLYLANPCNPTGSVVDPRALEAFLLELPSHVTAMVDEAYVDFCAPERRPSLGSIVERASARIIGVRTFSKFFALSGARIGYAYASRSTSEVLARGELPFGVSAFAEQAARAALADCDRRRETFALIAGERDWLSEQLAGLAIAHMPSQTNFLLFDSPAEPGVMQEALLDQGIVLPNVQQFLRNHCVLAVGRREHNAAVVRYLEGR